MKGPAQGLRGTQELFWTLITAPEGVTPAIADLTTRGRVAPDAMETTFAGDERLSGADRLDIYANMYFFRLLDCLGEDFPRARLAIGGDRFHNLVTDYLLRYPSAHPSLRHLGARLPEFARKHPIGAEFPYLSDLARLDWVRVDVFDRPDAAPITRADLATLPEERAGEARFRLVPAFELLHLDHDVLKLWRSLQDLRGSEEEEAPATAGPDGAAPSSACASSTDSRSPGAAHEHEHAPRGPRRAPRRATWVRVWRRDFIVYHRGIAEDEARCLESLARGDGLAQICQRIAAGRSIARATTRFGRLLQAFIDDGILAGYDLP